MPVSYSNDFRKKIIEEIQEKKQTLPEVADRFRVSTSFIYALWSRFRETGAYEAKQRGGRKPAKVDKLGEEEIKKWLSVEPDLTLNELCEKYHLHFTILMGKSSMDRALKRMNMTYKKKSL